MNKTGAAIVSFLVCALLGPLAGFIPVIAVGFLVGAPVSWADIVEGASAIVVMGGLPALFCGVIFYFQVRRTGDFGPGFAMAAGMGAVMVSALLSLLATRKPDDAGAILMLIPFGIFSALFCRLFIRVLWRRQGYRPASLASE